MQLPCNLLSKIGWLPSGCRRIPGSQGSSPSSISLIVVLHCVSQEFQELYEEIMEEIHPRSNEGQIDSKQLRSLSPNTFSRLVHENFAEEMPEKKSLFSDIT